MYTLFLIITIGVGNVSIIKQIDCYYESGDNGDDPYEVQLRQALVQDIPTIGNHSIDGDFIEQEGRSGWIDMPED